MNSFVTVRKLVAALSTISILSINQAVHASSPTTTGAVDYTQHGKNWNSYCLGRPIQSPIAIEYEKAGESENVYFEIDNYQDLKHAKLEVVNDKTVVQMRNPNDTEFRLYDNGTVIRDYHDSNLYFYNEYGERQLYHFEYL